MPVIFVIVPETFPAVGSNDIAPRFFANVSRFPIGNQVVPTQNISPAHFANTSAFGANQVTEGDLALIEPAHFDNTSVFGANEVVEAPPDEVIRPSLFTNTSSFPTGNEVDVAPADGFIRPTMFTNSSSFGTNQVVADTAPDDADEMIAGEIVGGQVI